MVNQPFPASAATGGAVVDGTYFETGEDWYQGGSATSATHRVVVIGPGNVFKLADDGPGDGGVSGGVGTYSTSGSAFPIVFGCGKSGTITLGYTATATSLVMYDANSGRVDSFAKQ